MQSADLLSLQISTSSNKHALIGPGLDHWQWLRRRSPQGRTRRSLVQAMTLANMLDGGSEIDRRIIPYSAPQSPGSPLRTLSVKTSKCQHTRRSTFSISPYCVRPLGLRSILSTWAISSARNSPTEPSSTDNEGQNAIVMVEKGPRTRVRTAT